MRTILTYEEMLECLYVADQTVGCSNCDTIEDDEHDDLTLFHREGCPLKGRIDVARDAPFKY